MSHSHTTSAYLTEEDRAIIGRNFIRGIHSHIVADFHDANRMRVREEEKASSTFSWEAWRTHRREWFPSGWGTNERFNPMTGIDALSDEKETP